MNQKPQSAVDSSLGRAFLAPALMFGACTLAGAGCASAPSSTAAADVRRTEAPTAQPTPPTEVASRDSERVIFSDEPAAGTAATAGSGSGDRSLVDALASSYSADMASLAQLQAQREEKNRLAAVTAVPPAVTAVPAADTAVASTVTAVPPAVTAVASAVTAVPPAVTAVPSTVTAVPSAVTAVPPAVTAVPSAVTAVPPAVTAVPPAVTAVPAAVTAVPFTVTAVPPAVTAAPPAVTAAPSTVTAAPSTVTAAPSTVTSANSALALPPTVPTDPESLAVLLAASLARRGAESAHPMQDWLAYAALAVGTPTLELPADFGADLLPAERERITKAHAAFATIGRLLAKGDTLDSSTTDALLAAFSTGPALEIPKLELCTKVESFGRYAPLGNTKFLARSNPRVIVYSELLGFASNLEEGQFVTRLATRISLESESDGLTVWTRNPEWTAVLDTSPVRRSEFFVGEIIPISEHLTVGSYRLRVDIRDESSGRVATASLPIHVVADAAVTAVVN